jgi:hypothetical protein
VAAQLRTRLASNVQLCQLRQAAEPQQLARLQVLQLTYVQGLESRQRPAALPCINGNVRTLSLVCSTCTAVRVGERRVITLLLPATTDQPPFEGTHPISSNRLSRCTGDSR